MADYGVSTTNPYDLLGDGDSTPKVLAKEKGAQKQKEQTVAKATRAAKKTDDAGRGGRRRPKREFDRRSGTGRGKENPKGGHGRGGWGRQGEFDEERKDRRNNRNRRGPRREQEGEQKTEQTAEETTEKTETPAEEVPEEEDDNTMTYEEYLKKRNENAVDGDRVQRRGVSNDNDNFKGQQVAQETFQEEQAYSVGSGLKTRRNKNKASKNTVYSFEDLVSNQRRGGRGGRGGRAGGRAGGRGGRGRRVDVDDKRAFPALGGK